MCLSVRCYSAPYAKDIEFMDLTQSCRQRQTTAQHAKEYLSVAMVTISPVPCAPAGGTV